MDANTDYVHDHVVNFEPTYNALVTAVREVERGERAVELVDPLADIVHEYHAEMGLQVQDLLDVDWCSMIEWEVQNG